MVIGMVMVMVMVMVVGLCLTIDFTEHGIHVLMEVMVQKPYIWVFGILLERNCTTSRWGWRRVMVMAMVMAMVLAIPA